MLPPCAIGISWVIFCGYNGLSGTLLSISPHQWFHCKQIVGEYLKAQTFSIMSQKNVLKVLRNYMCILCSDAATSDQESHI